MAEKQSPPEPAARMDDDRAYQKLDLRLMLRLWAYLLPYKRAAVVCFAISFVVSGLRLLQPVVIHNIIGRIEDVLARRGAAIADSPAPSRSALGSLVLVGPEPAVRSDLRPIILRSGLFLGLVGLILAFDVYFNYLTGVLGQRSMHDLRMAVYRHVSRLDVSYFDRHPVGRLVTRMTSDISTLNDLFSAGVVAMLADMLLLLGIIGLMFFYSAKLTWVVLSALPAILIILLIFRRHMRKWYLETRARIARMNAFLQENVSGMMTVQSFNREPRNFEMFENLNDRYRGAQVQTILGFALFYPAVAMVSNITLASVIWIGGRDLIQGRLMGAETLSFATLFLFVQCVSMLFGPMRQLSERYNLLQSAMASSARIFSLLDTRAQIVPPEDEVRPTGLNQGIEVQNVGFSYVAGEPVLRDVSFQIARGQTVAVVGHTGAGKTTLINLLTRFYDVAEGRILLDGVDLRRFDPRKLRRLYALVQQEVFLFSGTIASNLRMANPDLTDEEIWNLLREVRAEDFVRALPQGINSRIGERGSSLSTGQKQLLAFARALAVDPQFLILDEATANVDTATEQLIQEAIGRLLEGRTALVIAHRISTIQRADLILVMHKGRLHESGTHEELIARDGLYRKLYELQYRPETLAARAG